MNSEERRCAWTALSELRQRGPFQLSRAGRPRKTSSSQKFSCAVEVGSTWCRVTPERWAQIENLFHRAVTCGPEQRTALLDQSCSDDPELRAGWVFRSGQATASLCTSRTMSPSILVSECIYISRQSAPLKFGFNISASTRLAAEIPLIRAISAETCCAAEFAAVCCAVPKPAPDSRVFVIMYDAQAV